MKQANCTTGKRRFPNRKRAMTRLEEILDQPMDQEHLYTPVGVTRCAKCSGYHLTSKIGKRWKHGKRRNMQYQGRQR